MGSSSAPPRSGRIQPDRPRMLVLMIRPTRPTLAEVPLADLSAHESLASREMVAEVPSTGLSFPRYDVYPAARPGSLAVGASSHGKLPHRWLAGFGDLAPGPWQALHRRGDTDVI